MGKLKEIEKKGEGETGAPYEKDNDTFGPYELLNFIILDPYEKDFAAAPSSGLSKGAIAGIVLAAVAVAVTLTAVVSLILYRVYLRKHHGGLKTRRLSKNPIKVEGVKMFGYAEMARATNNFSDSAQVGQGGYGKVYKGILADGTVVAIKRAQEGSLQGQREFCTEIELLSRIHHRNLVSLVGYCDEEDEQMLVYEFMPNQTLRDHLSDAVIGSVQVKRLEMAQFRRMNSYVIYRRMSINQVFILF